VAPPANVGAVVCFVPGSEWCSVDLDDGGAGESVGSDEFVVGRVVCDDDHTDFASNALRAPREVAGLDTESTVLGVTTTGADKMDTLVSDTGVGWLSTLLESSVELLLDGCHVWRFDGRVYLFLR